MSWNDGKGTYWISYDFLGNQQEHSTTLTCPLQESSTLRLAVKSTSKLKEKKDCHVYPFLPDILPNFKRILCQFLAHNLFAKNLGKAQWENFPSQLSWSWSHCLATRKSLSGICWRSIYHMGSPGAWKRWRCLFKPRQLNWWNWIISTRIWIEHIQISSVT